MRGSLWILAMVVVGYCMENCALLPTRVCMAQSFNVPSVEDLKKMEVPPVSPLPSVEDLKKKVPPVPSVEDLKRKLAEEEKNLRKIRGEKILQQAQEDSKKLVEATQQAIAKLSEKLKKNPVYQHLAEQGVAAFMEEPQIVPVGAHFGGPPVVYVNGIKTTKNEAIEEALALSNILKRPVNLIYNPTDLEGSTGTPGQNDLTEAIYDRTRLIALNAQDIANVVAKKGKIELNPTTRQVTHLLYHAKSPVAIVSHSQGCLIVRNALTNCALLGQEVKMRKNVAWVTTGIPLNDVELWPKPDKDHYQYLINATDPVSAIIGVRGGPGVWESLNYARRDHDPVRNYFPRIDPKVLLFP